MTKVIATCFLIVIFAVHPLPGHTFGGCQGPPNSFKSVVIEKQKSSISVVPGPQDDSPCTSPVSTAVSEEASWQLLKVEHFIQIDLDSSGLIVGLKRIRVSDVPHIVKEAARKQGIEVK